MDNGRVFNHRNTMALLNLLGFSKIKEGQHGFAKFSLLGNDYEVLRFEQEICLALLLPTATSYEIYGFQTAMESILVDYPKLQGFYSEREDVFKVRLWLTYEDFGAGLRQGIEALTSIRSKLEDVMLGYVFNVVEPLFEEALSIESDEDDDEDY